MTPPPSSRLYSENGRSFTLVIHAFQKNAPARGEPGLGSRFEEHED
jgi:hypothetical protein